MNDLVIVVVIVNGNVYGAFIMTLLLREFTWFIS